MHKYSPPECRTTFWCIYSCKSFGVCLYKVYTSGNWNVLAIFHCNRAQVQSGWRPTVSTNCQVFPQILNLIQVWALTKPFYDINVLWSKSLHCSPCMFRIIVLLEGEPPNQSQVFCRGFLSGLLSIWFHQSSDQLWPDSLPLLKKSTSRAWWYHHQVSAWWYHHQVSRLYKLMCNVRLPKNSILISSDHMTHMTCVKLQTRIIMDFVQQWFFFLLIFHKHEICRVHN